MRNGSIPEPTHILYSKSSVSERYSNSDRVFSEKLIDIVLYQLIILKAGEYCYQLIIL